MQHFAIIGAAGYIAPRHLQAINDSGGKLLAAYDPVESVGILDRYSRDVKFFKSYEEFYFYLKNYDQKVEYISICSPNYLHRSHILMSLELGANAICEKPLVLSIEDINILKRCEDRTGKAVFSILQLREHEMIRRLKETVETTSRTDKYDIDLCYITSRGPWYYQTWKADSIRSGGLTFNIGIHFFDMLTWIFGDVEKVETHISNEDTVAGYLELERARVKWFLSINRKYLPGQSIALNQSTYRSITIENQELEFSDGFTELHSAVYQTILDGRGYRIEDAENAIKLVEVINTTNVIGARENSHPIVQTL